MPANRWRILQLGKYYPPHRGGIESYMESLCQQLLRFPEFDLHVIVSSGQMEPRREMSNGVSVERLHEVANLAGASICPSMSRAIKEFNPDLIHIQFPNPTAVLALLVSGWKGHIVVTYHSDIVRQVLLGRLVHAFQDHVLKQSSIIVTSPPYRDSSPVLRKFPDRCHVIPLGISTKPFECPSSNAIQSVRDNFGDRILLGVGRLVYYKGFEYAIRAMVNVDGHLVLIGKGPLHDSLIQLVKSLGLEQKVSLLGDVEDLSPFYHAAKAFVFPSIARSEAFGLVQLEAMACRTPVINTFLDSGVPYVSVDGVTGITVPPKDTEKLAAAMQRLLNDAALREKYGEAARTRLVQEFTDVLMADRTAALYHSILNSKQ